jgi:hypothetical protein
VRQARATDAAGEQDDFLGPVHPGTSNGWFFREFATTHFQSRRYSPLHSAGTTPVMSWASVAGVSRSIASARR